MDGHPNGEIPEPGNVVDFGEYSRTKKRRFLRRPVQKKNDESETARVYVDLDRTGNLSYGLSHADGRNALFLLAPVIYLADQLIRLAMDHRL